MKFFPRNIRRRFMFYRKFRKWHILLVVCLILLIFLLVVDQNVSEYKRTKRLHATRKRNKDKEENDGRTQSGIPHEVGDNVGYRVEGMDKREGRLSYMDMNEEHVAKNPAPDQQRVIDESLPVRHEAQSSRGQPWPMPVHFATTGDSAMALSKSFKFYKHGQTCAILSEAIGRYTRIIMEQRRDTTTSRNRQLLSGISIQMSTPCSDDDYPAMDSDESYLINIEKRFLRAREVWGVLRGLETFSQLIYSNDNNELVIENTYITDTPRFHHRGLMLDTSRHFIPKKDILLTLDAMSYNKMNVFHWHITDDQSFPFQSKVFPDLSKMGAYHKTSVYTHEDIKEILEYARFRGIRVIPEFDTPGHTRSWGKAMPRLMTECNATRTNENFNPTKKRVYTVLTSFFKEVMELFPDEYLHFGGDEVLPHCWLSNEALTNWVDNNLDGDISRLPLFYFTKLFSKLEKSGRKFKAIVWQDLIQDKVESEYEKRRLRRSAEVHSKRRKSAEAMPLAGTLIHVWKRDYRDIIDSILDTGYDVIFSACWYLNYIEYSTDWTKFYFCDADRYLHRNVVKLQGVPAPGNIVGGEACLWTEYVDATNLHQTLWPSASAVAERLWSLPKYSTISQYFSISSRLVEQRCRMRSRGINAGSNLGPGPSCLGKMPVETFDNKQRLETELEPAMKNDLSSIEESELFR